MLRYIFVCLLLPVAPAVFAQRAPLIFVHLSDTHVGSSTGADDLRRTVADINGNANVQFVIISGDITEFGADSELVLAKRVLDSLEKPWHIIPGNHDGNWSESGANSFIKVFGGETFSFNAGGYQFLGTACGPNMHMGPGQIPREDIVWLDSTLQHIPDTTPVIFVNHYPQTPDLNNWYEAIDRLKRKDIRAVLCGHGHSNHALNFEGIPAVMGRSNLRAKDSVGGYNIVTISNDTITYETRIPGVETRPAWAKLYIGKLSPAANGEAYARPSYQVNDSFPQVRERWKYTDKSDIGSGVCVSAGKVITSNTAGAVVALDARTGKRIWQFQTSGKIYSIPAAAGGKIVVGSSDGNIYALDESSGKQSWIFPTGKAVLAHPIIRAGIVYAGGSDGHFRALGLSTGNMIWDFAGVSGFIADRPLIYGNRIYFGCWNNDFYCLDVITGTLVWKWNNGSGNRMYSPAACFPVAANSRIFLVAPDRYMTALDANTGAVIWRKQMPDLRVRESMGLSSDSTLVFVKTMEGNVYGISTAATDMEASWKADVSLGYEICPTAITEKDRIIFIPGQSGLTVAASRSDGRLLWKHKSSNALITQLLPLSAHQLLVTTMDGTVSLLDF